MKHLQSELNKKKNVNGLVETFRYERNLLRTLIDNLPDLIYFKDAKGRYVLNNRAHLQSIGAKHQEDVLGKSTFDYNPPELAKKYYEDEMQIIHTGEPLIGKEEIALHRDTEKNYWHLTSKIPLIDAQGNITGIVGISRDITERKKAEEKIYNYTEELKQLNATKDRFFSIIAHDLKNPFITIMGFSDLLLSDYAELSDEERLFYLMEMKKTAELSHSLLQNLLQWSRSQTGRIEYNPQRLELMNLVNKNFLLLKNTAERKQIQLQNKIPTAITVTADEDMLDTVFRNLLTNAVKFSKKWGIISVDATRRDEFSEVCVSDTGVGMDEKTMDKLFRLDVTCSTQGTANEEGTGLGLILCKEFIEKNQGKIWVESEVGKGSKFFFTLPL
ncbi:MAG: PAS domain-containing sensor histidine kinase [Bacteroidetes bacterium]|nr:PAS domain-containing sensor histidine kinase [Bacteroidota bacterium]